MISKEKGCLTGYNGCDIYLMNNEKEVGYVQAITWIQENYLKGELILAKVEEFEEPLSILVDMNTETSPRKFLISGVQIFFNEENNTGVTLSYRADEMKEIL